MKFIVVTLLISILSFALGVFLPWWSLAIAAFIIPTMIEIKLLSSFFAGFIALFLLWSIHSFLISNANNHILAVRLSQIILKKESPVILIILTGSLGGIVAGFASLSGALVRSLFTREKSN